MFDPSPYRGGPKDSISHDDGPTAHAYEWAGLEFVEPGEVVSEFPSENVEPLAVPGCIPAGGARAATSDRLRRAVNASRESLSKGLSRSGEVARRVWSAARGTARWQSAHIVAGRRSVLPVSAGSFVLGVVVGAAVVWVPGRPSTSAAVVGTRPSQLIARGHPDAQVNRTPASAVVASAGVGSQKSTPHISPAPPLSRPSLTSSVRRVLFRGSLVVYSRPAGARVFLNGRGAGTTPLVLRDQRVGSGVVRIELNGYDTWTSAVQVVTNTTTSVRADLRRTGDAVER